MVCPNEEKWKEGVEGGRLTCHFLSYLSVCSEHSQPLTQRTAVLGHTLEPHGLVALTGLPVRETKLNGPFKRKHRKCRAGLPNMIDRC